jgi:ATP-dependent Lhr-like helicase
MASLGKSFGPATRAWFDATFGAPTPVQERGWEAIARGKHSLLVAPTGSGKTLAAFLWSLDALARRPVDEQPGVRVLYVSPLKALVYDVERNLRMPLAGMVAAAEERGEPMRPIRVGVRTGDTPQRERQRHVRDPAEILVTTPESLYLILGSRARETLRTVDTVIVDEIHALAPSKRGAHLALSLERLVELTGRDPQRIGLSATVRPPEDVAAFLGGARPVEIVDTSEPPRLKLELVVPVPDMEHADSGREKGAPVGERGIWPSIYPELVEAIRTHTSTIVFVNNRGLCERLAQRLNDLAGEELVLAHHGSVSHERRAFIEGELKAGRLRGIAATSSLELGIDMGAVDQVILVESPGAVARGLQRVGRAGHAVGDTSYGRIYPKFRGDLLECAVVAERMLRGEIEAVAVPENALDVLAQQVVAACCERPRTVAELGQMVRRAGPYRGLSDGALASVLDMLSGRFPGSDFAELRPRLAWDRRADVLSPRAGAEMVARLSGGTIPDRGSFGVYLGPEGSGAPRVGELDEEMVYETRDGEALILGASTWRVEEITRDRVIVSPAPGAIGKLPFWKGDGPGRPIELGRALGAFTRELSAHEERADAVAAARARLPADELAAKNLVDYLFDQKEQSALPTDRQVVVERFRDELGDWRVCVLSPFGSRVHAPWAMAIERVLGDQSGLDVQVMYTDDGLVLRFADTDELPDVSALFPAPEEVEELVTEKLGRTSLFASLFRENAVRSLLVPRRRPDQRNPLWLQRIRAKGLLATAERHASFPVLLETYRQALRDVFDLPALVELMRAIRAREIGVAEVETRSASPFARTLVFAYVAAYLYDDDSPVAERRAQALNLDRSLLRELLGSEDLRELIAPEALAEVERALACTDEDRRAADADELHDLLRRLGDLSRGEVDARCEGDAGPWLERLVTQGRACAVKLAGEERWIACEDAPLLRDAAGCELPGDLPDIFRGPLEQPLEQLARRFARTRGPFDAGELARRLGLPPGAVEPVLTALEREGELVHAGIRPGGDSPEWCDAEVLRRIKRRSLARLQDQASAVDAGTLGRFLPHWQGVVQAGGRAVTLEEAIERLEGAALPWSALRDVLLPARVPGFTVEALDRLSAEGRVVWIGAGAIGRGDGRVRLLRRECAGELVEPSTDDEERTPLHATLLELLEQRGACFLTELSRAVRKELPQHDSTALEAAVWDLVWSGEITNDTFQPLTTLGARKRRLGGGRWSRVADLVRADVRNEERAIARADALLARYGIVSREVAQDGPGGFAPVYQALRAMEERGAVRRGWFVEELSGVQFAHVGAVDRLRSLREVADAEPEVVTLAAVDPANPYGVQLAWPAPGARRVPGAWVVLIGGSAAVYAGANLRQLITFAEGATLERAFRALHELPRIGRRRALVIERIDEQPAAESPHRAQLEAAGFVPDYRGFIPDPARGASSHGGA